MPAAINPGSTISGGVAAPNHRTFAALIAARCIFEHADDDRFAVAAAEDDQG